MGISRLPDLMYKPLRYGTLADLVCEFIQSYKKYYHQIIEINLGLPFSHDRISETPLQWKVMRLALEQRSSWHEYHDAFIQYSKDCQLIFNYIEQSGKMPDWCTEKYKRGFMLKKVRRR